MINVNITILIYTNTYTTTDMFILSENNIKRKKKTDKSVYFFLCSIQKYNYIIFTMNQIGFL